MHVVSVCACVYAPLLPPPRYTSLSIKYELLARQAKSSTNQMHAQQQAAEAAAKAAAEAAAAAEARAQAATAEAIAAQAAAAQATASAAKWVSF
jgi:hypothetical protein